MTGPRPTDAAPLLEMAWRRRCPHAASTGGVPTISRDPRTSEPGCTASFPSNADLLEGDDRRQFMKLMGASFALAGLGAAACRRIPEQKIVPYATRPQERIPGAFMN